MTALAFLIGLALIVAGVAMTYLPAAFVVAGLIVTALSARYEVSE